MSGQPMDAEQRALARAGRWWPRMIVGLLVLNVGVCVVTVVAATTRPAQVEPDYYRKALEWDESRGVGRAGEGAGSTSAATTSETAERSEP